MPSKIDPRWFTTPVGAAVGLIIAHNLMQRNKRKPLGYALGAAGGGTGGFVLGSYLKTLEPYQDLAKAKSGVQQIAHMRRIYESNPDMLIGDLSPEELAITRPYSMPKISLDPSTAMSADETAELQANASALNQVMGFKMRLYHAANKLKLAERSGNAAEAKAWTDRIAFNQSNLDNLKGDIVGSAWNPLKGLSTGLKGIGKGALIGRRIDPSKSYTARELMNRQIEDPFGTQIVKGHTYQYAGESTMTRAGF